jgi:hypothetical protein
MVAIRRMSLLEYRLSGFFRVYPISALFTMGPESQRINQRKFYTKFCLYKTFITLNFHTPYDLSSRQHAFLILLLWCDFECGLPTRGLATLGVLRRGNDGGRPSDPLGVRKGILEDPRMFWSSSRLWMGSSLPWVDRTWIPTALVIFDQCQLYHLEM